jgi:hypothetical protein
MAYAQWNPTTTYIVGNCVDYAGFSYQATAINTNVAPQPTTPIWTLIGSSGGGGGAVNTITAGNPNITVGGTTSNVVLSGTLQTLTSNVATSNFAFSGNSAGNPSFVLGGTEEFKVITTDLTSQILVGSAGVSLGTAGTGYTVVAPTVATSTTNDTQVATTAFVQSVIGSSANVSSVSAGTNISITGTANAPIVNLQNPLTAQLNIADQPVVGSSTDGGFQTASIDEKTTSGIIAYDIKQYINTDPSNAITTYVNSEAQPTISQHYTYFQNTLTGQTAGGGVKAETNSFQLFANANDPTIPATATRNETVSGGQINNTSEVNAGGAGIFTRTDYAIVGIGVQDFRRVQAGGADNRNTVLIQSTQSLEEITYGAGATTAQNENVVDGGKSRMRNRYITTGVSNATVVDTTPLQCQIAQYYQSGATSRAGTITTGSTGVIVSSDNALILEAGSGANMTLTASGAGSVLVESLTINGTNITTTTTNADLDLTTNGTGAIHITQNAVGSNSACRITQTVAGGATNPALKLVNTDAGNSSVAIELFKNGSAGVLGDEVARLSMFGKNAGNTKEEYGRITCNIRDPSGPSAGADGQLLFGVPVGDTMTTFIDLNGNDNRVKILRALLLTNVPTSSAGLPTGAVWSNAGVLNIVP